MQRKVRLKDVAARAGVAVNTASTILNRRPNSWASKATEERVFTAAKELGYRPNRTARALQSGRYHALGLLVQDIVNPFFAAIADELESAVEARGLALRVENCRSNLAREERLFHLLNGMEVDGAVLWLSDNEVFRPALAQMFATGLPLVILGKETPATPFPVDAVLNEFTQGLTEATEALIALGHQRFAILTPLAEGQDDSETTRLFRELLVARGVSPSRISTLRCQHSIDSARDSFATFLRSKAPAKRPTALVAMTDLSAIGAMRAACDAGLRIPADLSVTGVDDIPLSGFLPVSLSSIRQRCRSITRAALKMLLERIENPGDPALACPRQIVFPTRFIRRESVGPAPLA